MAYEDFKDLPRRTASDKVLCDKAFIIDKSVKSGDKTVYGGAVKIENISNQKLAKELHKPINRKFEKWKL